MQVPTDIVSFSSLTAAVVVAVFDWLPQGRRGLPRDVCIQKMLDVYLGCCSIEMTAEGLAVAAATFANGGVCPITGREVFPAHVVRHVLAGR